MQLTRIDLVSSVKAATMVALLNCSASIMGFHVIDRGNRGFPNRDRTRQFPDWGLGQPAALTAGEIQNKGRELD